MDEVGIRRCFVSLLLSFVLSFLSLSGMKREREIEKREEERWKEKERKTRRMERKCFDFLKSSLSKHRGWYQTKLSSPPPSFHSCLPFFLSFSLSFFLHFFLSFFFSLFLSTFLSRSFFSSTDQSSFPFSFCLPFDPFSFLSTTVRQRPRTDVMEEKEKERKKEKKRENGEY